MRAGSLTACVRAGARLLPTTCVPVRLSGEAACICPEGVALNLGVCIASGWGGVTLLDMAFIDDMGAPSRGLAGSRPPADQAAGPRSGTSTGVSSSEVSAAET